MRKGPRKEKKRNRVSHYFSYDMGNGSYIFFIKKQFNSSFQLKPVEKFLKLNRKLKTGLISVQFFFFINFIKKTKPNREFRFNFLV